MKVGNIVSGKVKKIFKSFIILEFNNGFTGTLHISEVSDFFVSDIGEIFKLNKKYNFEVIKTTENSKRIKVSWKKINPWYRRNPFKFKIKETPEGFSNLKKSAKIR